MIFEDGFCHMLVVLGGHFLQLFGNMLCLEKIVNESCEHVFSVDSCTFSKDFQGPQGSEHDAVRAKVKS